MNKYKEVWKQYIVLQGPRSKAENSAQKVQIQFA